MNTERPAITLVQRVPDAAWFEERILAWHGTASWLWAGAHKSLAADLRGNLSPNKDAVLVDGPTLRSILDGVFANTGFENHASNCGMRASLSNPCTCWRAPGFAMKESLKEVKS